MKGVTTMKLVTLAFAIREAKKKLRGVFTRSTTIMQGAESSKRKTNFKMHQTKKFVQTRTRISSERIGQPSCIQ